MKYALSIFALALVACVSTGQNGPPAQLTGDLPSDADAGASFPDDDVAGVSSGDACAVSYRVLRSCHCPEAEAVQGVTFPVWCRSMGFAVDSPCIAKTKTCKALPACHVKCMP